MADIEDITPDETNVIFAQAIGCILNDKEAVIVQHDSVKYMVYKEDNKINVSVNANIQHLPPGTRLFLYENALEAKRDAAMLQILHKFTPKTIH